jgi:hypothetical protein
MGLLIQEYNFDIEYIPGRQNLMADGLSGNPINNLREIQGEFPRRFEREVVIASLSSSPRECQITELLDIAKYHREDSNLMKIRKLIEDKEFPVRSARQVRVIDEHIIYNDILFRRTSLSNTWRICVPVFN